MLLSYYTTLLSFVDAPGIKLRKPSWLKVPSPMFMYGLVLLSYFLVTGGIIYDVIVEPPSIGSANDDKGNPLPVVFLPYRVNGQYIMEGLASSFLFTLGGLGFIVLDRSFYSNSKGFPMVLQVFVGFGCILFSFIAVYFFLTMKLPGYLH
ncbi:Oligosaccharyltransferase complex subunit OSTC [Oopsacas minuta]|uniref:Oligosaccharyltransferase complex subunit n=1 Tax=Oopsacas minuta TaxID=111878 RepID=A0AAV7KEL1_9METZ|nr:Oligosaccharyltransferase complex subunit OSTC [Oopsacas minuta]